MHNFLLQVPALLFHCPQSDSSKRVVAPRTWQALRNFVLPWASSFLVLSLLIRLPVPISHNYPRCHSQVPASFSLLDLVFNRPHLSASRPFPSFWMPYHNINLGLARKYCLFAKPSPSLLAILAIPSSPGHNISTLFDFLSHTLYSKEEQEFAEIGM